MNIGGEQGLAWLGDWVPLVWGKRGASKRQTSEMLGKRRGVREERSSSHGWQKMKD